MLTVSNSQFRLLQLPFLCTKEVLSTMNPCEIINLSLASEKTESFVKQVCRLGRHFTYKAYIRIAKDATVFLQGSLLQWHYNFGDKFTDDGIEKLMEWYDHVKQVLEHCFIKSVDFRIVDFIGKNQKIIDWLSMQQEQFDTIEVINRQSSARNLKYLLGSVKVFGTLWLIVDERQFEIDFPERLQFLYIDNSKFVKIGQLLKLNSCRILLPNNSLTSREINVYMKNWMLMKSNSNLELLEIGIKNQEEMEVILDLPHEVVDTARVRNFKGIYGTRQLNGGVDIKRIDGKTATIITSMSLGNLLLSVYAA